MAPELILLIVNGVMMAYAYLWAYPSLPKITMRSVMVRDVAISVAALIVAGALYWGTQTTFSLIFFETNWFVFSLVTLSIIETPLFFRFAKKHNLSFDDLSD